MKGHVHNFPAEKLQATQKCQSILLEIKPRDLRTYFTVTRYNSYHGATKI
jgi:hypothetical protein